MMSKKTFVQGLTLGLSPGLAPLAFGQWSAVPLVSGYPFNSVNELRCGDLDGDGDQDVVAGIEATSRVVWFETRPGGGASVEHTIDANGYVSTIALGDFDGDGDLDVFVGGYESLRWYANDGLGGFAPPVAVPQPFGSHLESGVTSRAADLDGDGFCDLLLTTADALAGSDQAIHWYRSNAGALARERTFFGLTPLGESVIDDLDGDGDLDLVIPTLSYDPALWFRNDPAPGGGVLFTGVGALPPARWVLPTDFDGDGDKDLILVTGSQAQWSEGLGGGVFGPRQPLIAPHPVPGNTFMYQAELADLDGDGDDDLLLSIRPTNTTSAGTLNRVAWYENLGNQTLGPRQDLVADPFHRAYIGFAAADFDGDGDIDVVATDVVASSSADLVWHVNEHELGASTCAGAQNSTGHRGALRATGSRAVAANNLVLGASALPTSSFGLFIVSLAGAPPTTPPGSSGTLCLGGAIGRYVGPGQVQSTGTAGAFSLRLDLTSVPTPNGPVSALPGTTYHFQGWYRDAFGPTTTSNFTEALAVPLL